MTLFSQMIRSGILGALLIASLLVGGALAYAQNTEIEASASTSSSGGITFPIAELGGCADKVACKAYCDEGAHVKDCVAFAEAHGLMNKEEAVRAQKFASQVAAGKTPGACDSPKTCKAYCDELAHMEECLQFAETEGLGGQESMQGKKINTFLKSGGKTPGGCTSKTACEAYCSDFSHGEECLRFAQKAGIRAQKDMGGDGASDNDHEEEAMPTEAQFKILAELTAKGETPGGCTSKTTCEAYCRVAEHFEECTAFGTKVGFIKKEDVERMKKFAGKGPGGCTSPEACHAYCNDATHRDECFKFAEENGLIPKEEVEQMKEGLVRMRAGVNNAPEEVQRCLKSTLGDSAIEDIQSGKFVPGPEVGEKMRGCFEKFGDNHDPKEVFREAPPEVAACLKEKLGEQFTAVQSGEIEPTPEIADGFRVCAQQMEMMGEWGNPNKQQGMGQMMQGKGQMNRGSGMMEGQGGNGPDPKKLQGFLRSAPPEVSTCLKEKLGEQFAKIESGESMPSPEIGDTMRACFESFRPNNGMHDGEPHRDGGGMPQRGGVNNGMSEGRESGEGRMMRGGGPTFAPEVISCLKNKLSEEELMQLLRGSKPASDKEKIIGSCMTEFSNSQGGQMQRVGGEGQMRGGEGMMPPKQGDGQMYPPMGENGMMPPMNGGMPPEGMRQPMNNQMMPPPGGFPGGDMYQQSPENGEMNHMQPPPPPQEGAPQSRGFLRSMMGAVAAPFVSFLDLFR